MKRKESTPQSYVILGLLMDGAKHGYEIHRSKLLQIWSIPMSQLYILLKRLEEAGKIHVTRTVQENRPEKKVYTLTPEGRRSFLEWVRRPSEKIRNIRTEFLAKLSFVYRLRLEIGERLVEDQITVCKRRREVLRYRTRGLDPFEKVIQQYRFAVIDATIQWLENCLILLEEEKND